MTESSKDLLDAARSTRACMADVRALASRLADLSIRQIESLLQGLVDSGEDRALSRMLQACAFNEIKLTPELLCRCIGVCEDMPDSGFCFRQQDANAIAPLLATATAKELSWERQAYAGRLAAELCVRFGQDPQPVRKVLSKLQRKHGVPQTQLLISESLHLLESGLEGQLFPISYWSELKLSELLPEQAPRHAVGGDYTVRRPIPKLGRNEPCHCGSGRKYKKCCYAKDQELLRDASQYAGTTRSELMAHPGLVDDPAVIDKLRAYELKQLKPSELSAKQLISGYRRALGFGLLELAFDMLVERENRPCEDEFDPGHFEDLLDEVLQAEDLELARRIQEHCRGHEWYRPHAIQFHFDLLEQPERYQPLEQDCRNSLCGIAGEDIGEDDPVIRLAYDFAARFPALAIVFARAAIVGNPDRELDCLVLLDVIRDCRLDLDLEIGSDPAEELFDWIEDRSRLKTKERSENELITGLSDRLDATRADLDEKKQVLREREQRVDELGRELEKARRSVPRDAGLEQHTADADQDREQSLQRLSRQVENLKAEIGTQQEQRRQLRKKLADERKSHQAATPPAAPRQQEQDGQMDGVEPSGIPLLPEYSDAFRKSCNTLPPAVAAKAILAVGRFAAQESAIWRQTKPLERLPEHYRIRIGRDYRLLVHWQAGEVLRILDLIPRQDLEGWIKRHG